MASFTVGESYGALHKFQHYPKIFVEGPRGTAKSRSILSFFLALLLQYPGARLLVCRRYRAELTKTILTTLEEEVFPAFGMKVPGGAHRNNRSEYLLDNGSIIWPAGIDDGMGVLSMGISYAYPAEVIEMTEETVTDIAGGLRWLRSPERPTLPDTSLMIMDANPGPPAHWSNQKSEPVDNSLRYVRTVDDYLRLQSHNYRPAADPVNKWKRIITKHQDNPGYWDHDAWDYTRLGRNYVTQQLEGLTGHKRERWLNGLWKAAEGSVYPEFDEDQHVVTPFPIPSDWPMYVGMDPGYQHPCAVLWFAVSPNETLYVVDEVCASGMGIPTVAEAICARSRGRNVQRYYGDPQYIFNKRQEAGGKSVVMQFRELGKHAITFTGWPRSTNVDAMVEAVRKRLQLRTLKVFRTCSHTITGFQTWSYKRTAQGDLPPGDDKYEELGDDEMDVVRGIVAANPTYKSSGVRIIGEDHFSDRLKPRYPR